MSNLSLSFSFYFWWINSSQSVTLTNSLTQNVNVFPDGTQYWVDNEMGGWSFPTISSTAQYLDSSTYTPYTITRTKETTGISLFGEMPRNGYLIRASAYKDAPINIDNYTHLHVLYDVANVPANHGSDYANNFNIRMFPTVPDQVQINDTAVVFANGSFETALGTNKLLTADLTGKTGNLYLSLSICVYDVTYSNSLLGIKIKQVWAD